MAARSAWADRGMEASPVQYPGPGSSLQFVLLVGGTDDLLWSVFGYQPYTHAYVPQDRFDEVVQEGGWTFARKGDGYVALWSWRATSWRTYDPAVYATDGMVKPFDLVAEGGADNVWIVEVGERTDGTFEAWRASVARSAPVVDRSPAGFTVAWTSPSAGTLRFGSAGPFEVRGKPAQIAEFPRHESAFGRVKHLETTYRLASRRAKLDLDFVKRTRKVGRR